MAAGQHQFLIRHSEAHEILDLRDALRTITMEPKQSVMAGDHQRTIGRIDVQTMDMFQVFTLLRD